MPTVTLLKIVIVEDEWMNVTIQMIFNENNLGHRIALDVLISLRVYNFLWQTLRPFELIALVFGWH